jgi:transglutaminase-like putative cysteine protease
MKDKYLAPTPIIDSDHAMIIDYAAKTIGLSKDPVEQAVKLYYAVRDSIWYDPYYPFYLPEHYQASNVLKSGRGYCVSKASLLCALGRALKIPTRLSFFDVQNHLATKQLLDFYGSDLFVFHGITEFYLNGKWIKATPAFNARLCKIHAVSPLEFNGREDSVFQPFNLDNQLFMEYVAERGAYSDVPVNKIVAAWEQEYGKDRVKSWIKKFEQSGGNSLRDFAKEEVWKGRHKKLSA